MNSYKITAEIENDIELLEEKFRLVTVNYSDKTFKFNEIATGFFQNLNADFSRGAQPLLRVGEALGIITAEQVADWKTRRAEMEAFVSSAFASEIAAGKNDKSARAAAIAAWEAHLTVAEMETPAVTGEIEEIEVSEYDRETDEMTTVTTYRVTVNGETDVRYFYDRADAEKLLARSLAAERLVG